MINWKEKETEDVVETHKSKLFEIFASSKVTEVHQTEDKLLIFVEDEKSINDQEF